MIVDGFTFFNEFDVLELRLGELYDVVDKFVLVEATKTFTGKDKPLFYAQNAHRFEAFSDKICHIIVDDMPEDAKDAWDREHFQRSAIGRGLGTMDPNDLVVISDVDEIPIPDQLEAIKRDPSSVEAVTFMGVDIYRFRWNCRFALNDTTSCPRIMAVKHFQDAQKLRSTRAFESRSAPAFLETLLWRMKMRRSYGAWLNRKILPSSAWHFSYIGDYENASNKVASYSHQEHMQEGFLNGLKKSIDALAQGSSDKGEILPPSSKELPAYMRGNPKTFAPLMAPLSNQD